MKDARSQKVGEGENGEPIGCGTPIQFKANGIWLAIAPRDRA